MPQFPYMQNMGRNTLLCILAIMPKRPNTCLEYSICSTDESYFYHHYYHHFHHHSHHHYDHLSELVFYLKIVRILKYGGQIHLSFPVQYNYWISILRRKKKTHLRKSREEPERGAERHLIFSWCQL